MKIFFRQPLTRAVTVAAAAAAAVAFPATAQAELGMRNSYGMIRDVSRDGHNIDWLLGVGNIAIIGLFTAMAVWLFAACILHRQNKHKAVYETGEEKGGWILATAIALGIFFLLDGTLFIKSYFDVKNIFWNFAYADSQTNVVRIELNAHQWLWDARYEGPDAKFNTPDDPVVTNHIRVPINRPVLIQMGAVDVLHSLYIPQLRAKQDIVPGTLTQAWFVVKEAGQYEIACAQHCGANHYQMRGILEALPEDAYDDWVKLASSDSEKLYDPENATANWGWAWRKN